MKVKSCLKAVLECWDDKFLMYILGFQKSNIGWSAKKVKKYNFWWQFLQYCYKYASEQVLVGIWCLKYQKLFKTLIRSRFQGMYWCAHKTATLISNQHTGGVMYKAYLMAQIMDNWTCEESLLQKFPKYWADGPNKLCDMLGVYQALHIAKFWFTFFENVLKGKGPFRPLCNNYLILKLRIRLFNEFFDKFEQAMFIC